ncbi:DUF1134 domain-containing protein [Asticcacaulis sp.]|jgi:hypothetical protein|uniref:DUF1134 domain-containing protein n=1 Tax=unclassified Asticcacaulis TaxID=2628350 RepID=UPI0025C5A73E|nr:DUF1134 domain-containing protein [Asticcacaulis sp.]MCA1933984.1 DUF1134 domain-containing protein [Asticcacaulis sp.]
MERRHFLMGAAATAATPLIASPLQALAQTGASASSSSAPSGRAEGYQRDEILRAGSDFLGVTVEALGGAIEKIFSDYGDRPTAYIAGEEVSGAIAVGLRYGKGLVHMKALPSPQKIFWRGPSVGFDTGGNASRVFSLVYGLYDVEKIYQRFPGVDGSAYFIGGLGVNYQQSDDTIVAPIRAGVGFRLGANIGYLAYSKTRKWFPA